jgi:prolyl oligopeptidase
MISVLIFVAGSSALALAQTKTAEKDAPVAALARPETPVRDVKETFFGTEISDPYRWLEDLKSPEVS